MNTNPLAALGLVAFLVLSGCGKNTEQQFNSNGRGGGTGNVPLPSTSQGLLAECTRVPANPPGVVAQVSTYYSGGSMVAEYLQLNLETYPAAQMTATAYAQLYRWKETTAGQRQTNSIPVRFYYVSKLSGTTANSTPLNLISRSSIQNLINTQKLDQLGVTTTNFFQHYYVVLIGMELQWEAMTISFYDSAQGSTSIGSADVLLPPFLASPIKYSAYVPVPSLQVLHPMYNQIGSGASEQEFKRLSEEICAAMFGTIRAPSSISADEDLNIFQKVWMYLKALWS